MSFTQPASEEFKRWFYQQKERTGLTIDELAARAGYSRGHIYNVLRQDKDISIQFCYRLSGALGLVPQDVLTAAGFVQAEQIPERLN